MTSLIGFLLSATSQCEQTIFRGITHCHHICINNWFYSYTLYAFNYRSQCYSPNNTEALNRSTCLLSTQERIATFAGTLVGVLVLNFLKTFLFFTICINASRVLHNRMFGQVLRTPMVFFDTNPIGMIVCHQKGLYTFFY